MPAPPKRRPSRLQIDVLAPVVGGGRGAPKRCVGEVVEAAAAVFSDGHDVLRAVLRWKGPDDRAWSEADLHLAAGRGGLARRVRPPTPALSGELAEGAPLPPGLRKRAKGDDRQAVAAV